MRVHVIASPRKLTHRDLAQRDRRATAAKLNVSTSVARHAGFSGDSEHAANNPTRVMSATGPAWWLTSGHLTAEFPKYPPILNEKDAEIAKLRVPVPHTYVLERAQ